GTADALEEGGVEVKTRLAKLGIEEGTTAVDLIEGGEITLVVNSTKGGGSRADGHYIRSAAGVAGIPCLTTAAAGLAAAEGMAHWAVHQPDVRTLPGID